MPEKERKDIKFNIEEKIGILSTHPTGWKKELNLVAWNDSAAKYDLRDWDPDYTRMSRGVTLSSDEMKKLKELIDAREF